MYYIILGVLLLTSQAYADTGTLKSNHQLPHQLTPEEQERVGDVARRYFSHRRVRTGDSFTLGEFSNCLTQDTEGNDMVVCYGSVPDPVSWQLVPRTIRCNYWRKDVNYCTDEDPH